MIRTTIKTKYGCVSVVCDLLENGVITVDNEIEFRSHKGEFTAAQRLEHFFCQQLGVDESYFYERLRTARYEARLHEI